jgi:hypothetical protein
VTCHACGHASPDRARFCPECGTPRAPACAGCGAELPPGSRFCAACGIATGTAPNAARSPAARDLRSYTPKHLADKIQQSKSALEGERKQVTVLFEEIGAPLHAERIARGLAT